MFRGHQPRQRAHQGAERVAAYLEIAILVERSAGRRKQHDRLDRRRGFGIARGCCDSLVERSRDFVGHFAAKRGGELFRRLADQIRFADARKECPQRLDAAGFRLAAGDPENVAEAGERLGRRIGIGRFGIVDEQADPAPADLEPAPANF